MLGCLTLVVMLTTSSSASGPAEGGAALPLQLEWDVPPQCPPRASVLADVERFLPPELAAGGIRPAKIRANIRSDDDQHWKLALDVEVAEGHLTRSLEGESCEVVTAAAALVIAVMLDPASVLEEVTPIVEVEPEPEPAPEAPPPSPEPGPRKIDARGLVRLGALGAYDLLPRFAAGVSGAVGVKLASARLYVVATWLAPQRALARGDLGAGADLQAWTVGLRGCWAPSVRRVDFPLCVSGSGGAIEAVGVGLTQNRSARGAWGGLGLSAGVAYAPVRWLALVADAEGVLGLTRPRFVIDDLGEVHRARRGGVRIGAGVEARFP